MRAVCILFDSKFKIQGKVKMEQKDGCVYFSIFAENLSRGKHGFHIHKAGDLSRHCDSLCEHYNPKNTLHGGRSGKRRHKGDLGNIKANRKGIVKEKFKIRNLSIREILGRSLIVHQDEDDLGKGNEKDSKTTGHSGKRVLCGVIGISYGC